MIRGYFGGPPGRLRPFVVAHVAIGSAQVAGDVHFLVDTGADTTVLAPRDVVLLGLDVGSLPQARTTGVGGTTAAGVAAADITLDTRVFSISLRVLNPRSPAQRVALRAIPSLLGRDILAHFALFHEQRTNRVLLLDSHEADALHLP